MPPSVHQAPRPGLIRINPSAYEAACRLYGLANDAQAAKRLGISRTTLGRVRRGQQAVGAGFIVSALTAMPGLKFDQLFTIEPAKVA